MNEESLFEQARQLPQKDRSSFLERHCSGQPDLRNRVDALLAADGGDTPSPLDPVENFGERTGEFIPSGISGSLPAQESGSMGGAAVQSSGGGAFIAGRYKLRQQIGEGGMGTVWMAEQIEPVRRMVALKLIRVERGQSKAILARFEAERQAIAMMDHPHIAKLLDAGTTDEGSPFFVMELVKGVPLNEFCDQKKLTIPERLDLFVKICGAIQHAHQKGIIHRDLKPSNILVESHDGKAVPKVIDFGLAKATTGISLTDQSLFTAFGSVMGTPLYMAPEQATFNAIDVDTRADVYSLGVVLYELLTGTTPITRDSLKKAAMDEMLRLIREEEAPSPSSRIESAETTPGAAASRQIEPARLGRMVKGDLDWIVLKSLSKERERRYETANAFAQDIQRYLDLEPVLASPPSALYRIKKFVRRNRGRVIAAGLVLLALIGGIVGTTWQAFVAEEARAQEANQREKAEHNERVANESLKAEAIAKEQALRRLQQVEKSYGILGTVFEQLDIREVRKGDEPLEAVLAKKLVQAGKQLDSEAIGDPLVTASLQYRLGKSLFGLGFYPESKQILEKSLQIRRDLLGADDPETLETLRDIGLCNQSLGKWKDAVSQLETVQKCLQGNLEKNDPSLLRLRGELAMCHLNLGAFDQAIPVLEEVYESTKNHPGTTKDQRLQALGQLAQGYLSYKQLDKAILFLDQAFAQSKANNGPNHPKTFETMLNLAAAYRGAKEFDKAEALSEETRKLTQLHLGPEHPYTLTALNSLAVHYQATGQYDLAIPLLEEAIQRLTLKRGPDHQETLLAMNNLAATCWSAKKLNRSIPLFEKVLKIQEKTLGRKHPNTIATISNLAVNLKDQFRYKEALVLFQEAYKSSQGNPNFRHVVRHLMDAYLGVYDGESAEKLLPEVLAETRTHHPAGSVKLATVHANFALVFLDRKRYKTAENLLKEPLAIFQKKQPEAWSTFQAQSALGAALLGQKKYTEAEPLLVKGLEGLKAHAREIPASTLFGVREGIDRLVELYEATGKPAEAAKYRQLLSNSR